MKAILFMVVLLSNVAVVSAADSDSDTSKKNVPTFKTLQEGFCYLKPMSFRIGRFEFVQKAYCDRNNGVLFHRDDCKRVDPAFKSICVEAKDNDNINNVEVVYKALTTEAKRIKQIQKAVGYLTNLGYYKGTSTSISVIEPAISKFLVSTSLEMSLSDAIVRNEDGLRTVSNELLTVLDEQVNKVIQLALIELGLYQGLVDGVVGPETKAAINLWLKNEGKPPLLTIEPPPTPESAVDNGIDGTWSGRTKGCKWSSGNKIKEHLRIFVVDGQVTSINFHWPPRNKRIKGSIGSEEVLTVSASHPPIERIKFSGRLVNNGAMLRGSFGSSANHCAINLTRIPPLQKASPKVLPTVVITKELVDDITTAAQFEKARKTELARVEAQKKAEAEEKARQAEIARVEAEKQAEAEAKRKRIAELAKMKSEFERVASENKGLLAANKELSVVVASVTADRDRLSTELKVSIESIESLQGKHDGLASDKAKLLSDKAGLEGALSKLEAEHRSLQGKHVGLASDKAELLSTRSTLEGELSKLKIDLAELQSKFLPYQEEIEKRIADTEKIFLELKLSAEQSLSNVREFLAQNPTLPELAPLMRLSRRINAAISENQIKSLVEGYEKLTSALDRIPSYLAFLDKKERAKQAKEEQRLQAEAERKQKKEEATLAKGEALALTMRQYVIEHMDAEDIEDRLVHLAQLESAIENKDYEGIRNILRIEEAEKKVLAEEQEKKDAEKKVLTEEQEKKEAEKKRLAEEARLIAEKAAESERKRNILNDAELLHKEYFGAAEWDCAKAVEKEAKWDFEWLDGMFTFKFDRYKTTVETPGVLVVLGDKLKFQNGFGAWTRMNYSCHYDGPNERVLGVEVW